MLGLGFESLRFGVYDLASPLTLRAKLQALWALPGGGRRSAQREIPSRALEAGLGFVGLPGFRV